MAYFQKRLIKKINRNSQIQIVIAWEQLFELTQFQSYQKKRLIQQNKILGYQ
ncbi:unnamed protein product [Paramecium octaurelia]|uniref:Uncharacterized protein n=1 Tax=Paramecium octaurelia TaxID=43137 RepID=A0A8S1TGI1_PAROT|nr:unnamed protein product [Paramecium octaurelia]